MFRVNGKSSFPVADLNKLKLNEDPKKTPSFPDLSNTPTESHLLDLPDINLTEDDNINNSIKTHKCNLPNQIRLEEEITALKTEVAI